MPAHALFFPAAAAYAAVALPASVLAMLGVVAPLPGLATPLAHAHEMLFGFTLAVVAGHQLGPTPWPAAALLAGAWLAARAAFLVAPGDVATALAGGAFAALLAYLLAPRLLGRAKKWRNRALPATLIALCAAAIASQAAHHAGSLVAQRATLVVAVLLVALLMLFMGGRIIAPVAAGAMQRQGGNLEARVQPRLEGAILVAMALAVSAAAIGWREGAGLAAAAAAGVALARLARWRLWRLRGRPDVACLGVGYAWLAAGLAAIGVALVRDAALVTALHVVTVGALGTLTVNVMALTWLRWVRRDPARARLPVAATAAIAAATLLRLAADADLGPRAALLTAGAAAWSLAFILLLALMATARGREPPPR